MGRDAGRGSPPGYSDFAVWLQWLPDGVHGQRISAAARYAILQGFTTIEPESC